MRLDRLTERKQFLAAAEHGRRFRSYAFTVQLRDRDPEEAAEGLRLGLTASRKVGNAVIRNRIRRRLRAAAELALADAAARPLDMVVVARATAVNARFDRMAKELAQAIDRARAARDDRPPSRTRSPRAGARKPGAKAP